MNDKTRKSSAPTKASSAVTKKTKKTMKHWIAVTMFAAIIVVFALMGLNPDRYGQNTGAVAAVVNDSAISLAEYRGRVESIEKNAKMRFDQFPEAQRRAFSQELRRRALEELIMGEVVFQAAEKRGVAATDAEVRDYILQIGFLQENGRFMKERYRGFLQNMNLRTEDFERQVRKQIVGQKLQDLFVGSAAPTQEELSRARVLSSQKVNLRYVEIAGDDLKRPGFLSDEEVAQFLKVSKSEIDSYYRANPIEFTSNEKVHARHILIRVDEKRTESEALKVATALKKQATAQNFAKLAMQNSDDPGSKAKGGDLGEFEKGRMLPEFEKAAFALSSGQISEPVKTNFGYHLIFSEKKTSGGMASLESVQNDIARKLILRTKQNEVLAKARGMLEKSSRKDVEAWIAKAGLKWQESGEFDLSSPAVPKLGDSQDVIAAVMKHGKQGGIVPTLISTRDRHLIVDVLSWKQAAAPTPASEGADRAVAFRKSSDLIETWSKEVEAGSTVQRNPRILQ